jgi:hypothetical protein
MPGNIVGPDGLGPNYLIEPALAARSEPIDAATGGVSWRFIISFLR